MKCLTPVIHVHDLDTTLKNVDICVRAKTKGVFLINHRIRCNRFQAITVGVRERFPDTWIGVNVLDESALTAAKKFVGLDIKGWWVDDPCLYENVGDQLSAQAIRTTLGDVLPDARYFGGVAFKYQTQPNDLKSFTTLACRYMDVITTSGEATGNAADVRKIMEMKNSLILGKEFAIASGITPENVRDYLPYVDWFLVATGISKDFSNLDPAKVNDLQGMIANYT